MLTPSNIQNAPPVLDVSSPLPSTQGKTENKSLSPALRGEIKTSQNTQGTEIRRISNNSSNPTPSTKSVELSEVDSEDSLEFFEVGSEDSLEFFEEYSDSSELFNTLHRESLTIYDKESYLKLKHIEKLRNYISKNSDITQYAVFISNLKKKAQHTIKAPLSQENYQLEILERQKEKGEKLVIEKFLNLPLDTPLLPEAQEDLKFLIECYGELGINAVLLSSALGIVSLPLGAIGACMTIAHCVGGPALYVCTKTGPEGKTIFTNTLPPELKTGGLWQTIKLSWLENFGLVEKYRAALIEESKLQTNLNNYVQAWFNNIMECMKALLKAAPFTPGEENKKNVNQHMRLKSQCKLLEDITSSAGPTDINQFSTLLPEIDSNVLDAAIELRCIFLHLFNNELFFPKGGFITINNKVMSIEESKIRGVEGTVIPQNYTKHLSPEDERNNSMVEECQKYIITSIAVEIKLIETEIQKLEPQILEASFRPNAQPQRINTVTPNSSTEVPPSLVTEVNLAEKRNLNR